MITAMCDVMKEAFKRNWITTRDGNCSIRRSNSKTLYITPSGVRKNVLIVEGIVKLKLDENDQLDIPKLREEKLASGEIVMHHLLQTEDNTKTRCVLHLHPTYIVAAMYAGLDLAKIASEFPEIFRYTKVGQTVGFLPATSDELGIETKKCLTGFNIVGQKNHGATAIGRDPWEALEHIERLEHICKIVLSAK